MDIDSDISNASRQKVIEYVQHKYGAKAVCGLITMNAQAPKGALNIAAKYYGLKQYGEKMTALGKTLSKAVPTQVGVSFATLVNPESGKPVETKENGCTLTEYLQKKFSTDDDAQEIIRWATIIEGAFTTYSAHAAGIGIMNKGGDISDYIPLRMNTSLGMMTSQCNMVQFEENGFLKFDFLGLKTLDIITETLFLIEKNYGIVIDPLKIDLNDPKVYREIFQQGKTNSVFQFESAGMKDLLKRFLPDCFEDLIIPISMYRPGPMQFIDDVIDVKRGVKKADYLCPELEPILGKTYGAIVYQGATCS